MKTNQIVKQIGMVVSLATITACGDRAGITNLKIGGTYGTQAQALRALEVADIFKPLAIPDFAIREHNGTQSGTLTLTTAKLVLKDIRFKKELSSSTSSDDSDDSSDDDDSDTLKFEGPFVVDLIQNTVTPSIETLAVPAGTYKRIRLNLHKLEQNKAPAGLDPTDSIIGNSIYIAGAYTGQVSTGAVSAMPLELKLEVDEEFDIESEKTGIVIDSASNNDVLIAFRLNHWFNLGFHESNPDEKLFSDIVPTSGAIALNKDANSTSKDVFEVIRKNIKESCDFGKDSDDDGSLDESEDEGIDSEDDSN